MFSKMTLTTRGLLAAATCLTAAAATAAPTEQILDSVFSDGFNDWFNAAQTSQADIFLMGDSTVLTGGGWAHALNSGFANSSIGLAGSGLLAGRNQSEGEGGGYFQISQNADFGTTPPVNGIRNDDNRDFNFEYFLPPTNPGQMIGDASNPQDPTFITPFGTVQVNANNIFGPTNRGVEIDGNGIDGGTAHTFSVELGNAAANNVFFDVVRRSFAADGTQQTVRQSGFSLAADADLSVFDFTFDADPGYNDSVSFTIETQETPDIGGFGVGLEIGNFRLRNDSTTGVTVTSWGYGGQTTEDFLSEQYLPLTEDFRQSTLNQIVAGGSGELLVVITEGFNDLSAGDTPAEFVSDIQALQAAITADFVAAGNSADQLSFLAFGQHLTGLADPWDDDIAEYSLALRDAALVDDSLSFIDLRQLTADEDLNTVVARLDGARLHFGNQTQAEFYGDALVTAIPEPTTALLLGAGGLMLTRRRPA